MAWLEAHQDLLHHPKTRKAARALGVPRVQVVGHLFALWWWALDYAEDGDLTRFDRDDIELAAEWEGDPGAFVAALVGCRFGDGAGLLDDRGGRLVINDWMEYAGKLVEKRRSDAERKRAGRNPEKPTPPAPTAPKPPPADDPSEGRPSDIHGTAQVNQPTNSNQPTGTDRETGGSGGADAPAAAAATPPDAPHDRDVPAENDAAPPGSAAPPPPGGRPANPKRDEGKVYALVDAFAVATKRRRDQIQGRDRRDAAEAFRPLAGDATAEDVVGTVVYLRSDPFWREPGRLTARKVAATLPEWVEAGRPAAERPRDRSPTSGNGRPASRNEEARANLRAVLDIAEGRG